MDLTLRLAVREDAADISRLVSAVTSTHIASTLGDGGLTKLLDSMSIDATLERLADDWHTGAWLSGALVGVVVVKPATHLFHLFVQTDQQGQGIGATLFAAADEYAQSVTGAPVATVNASLNAIPIYERWGFRSHGAVVDTDGVRFQPMRRDQI